MKMANEITTDSYILQGNINSMANSSELLIDEILKKQEVQFSPRSSFSRRLDVLEETIADLNTNVDKVEMMRSLRTLNKYWDITKHGKMVGNLDLTFLKDRVITQFTKELIKEIINDFTENQKRFLVILRKCK